MLETVFLSFIPLKAGKAILMGLGPEFWDAEHPPAFVPASHFHKRCIIWSSTSSKSFCWQGEGVTLNKLFSNVKNSK